MAGRAAGEPFIVAYLQQPETAARFDGDLSSGNLSADPNEQQA